MFLHICPFCVSLHDYPSVSICTCVYLVASLPICAYVNVAARLSLTGMLFLL